MSQYAQERLALDVLHDEVRLAGLGRAAVEEPRDVRVVQRRRDLPLAAEAAERDVVREARETSLIATCFWNSSSARRAR